MSETRRKQQDQLWSAVLQDPEDFPKWTQLLKLVLDEVDIQTVRRVFSAFLDLYPLCFAYWNKWADTELRVATFEDAKAVFEKATSSFPLSVDIWLLYLTTLVHYETSSEKIEATMDTAIASAGQEYKSESLWRYYLGWLDGCRNWTKMVTVYGQVLSSPVQNLDHFFRQFEDFVKDHSLEELFTRGECLQLLTKHDTSCTNGCNASGDGPFIKDYHCQSKTSLKISSHTEACIKSAIIKEWQSKLRPMKTEMKKCEEFEVNIKRPYFHVSPLDYNQLTNWNSYLDWAIVSLSSSRVITLFERCLVSCALYEQFWLKYVSYLDSIRTPDQQLREVFDRCCKVHLRKSVTLHCNWALFEEQAGHPREALRIIESLDDKIPNLLHLIVFRLNLLRRTDQSTSKLEKEYQNLLHKHSSNPDIFGHLSLRYSLFLRKTLGRESEAVSILKQGLTTNPENLNLTLQLIDIELNKRPMNVEKILTMFDHSIRSVKDPNSKHLMLQRKYEFAQCFSKQVQQIYATFNELYSLSYFTEDPQLDTGWTSSRSLLDQERMESKS